MDCIIGIVLSIHRGAALIYEYKLESHLQLECNHIDYPPSAVQRDLDGEELCYDRSGRCLVVQLESPHVQEVKLP